MKHNNYYVDLPICDICNKQVQQMDWRDDFNFDARIFKVKCHGESETVILSALTMVTCDITVARAFVRKLLK